MSEQQPMDVEGKLDAQIQISADIMNRAANGAAEEMNWLDKLCELLALLFGGEDE